MSKKISMKLQIFAEPPQPPEQNPANPPQAPEGQSVPAFDYDKLANLIAGKQSVTEESVLKGYFKQQGLSKEQMEQAITAFKQQQAVRSSWYMEITAVWCCRRESLRYR